MALDYITLDCRYTTIKPEEGFVFEWRPTTFPRLINPDLELTTAQLHYIYKSDDEIYIGAISQESDPTKLSIYLGDIDPLAEGKSVSRLYCDSKGDKYLDCSVGVESIGGFTTMSKIYSGIEWLDSEHYSSWLIHREVIKGAASGVTNLFSSDWIFAFTDEPISKGSNYVLYPMEAVDIAFIGRIFRLRGTMQNGTDVELICVDTLRNVSLDEMREKYPNSVIEELGNGVISAHTTPPIGTINIYQPDGSGGEPGDGSGGEPGDGSGDNDNTSNPYFPGGMSGVIGGGGTFDTSPGPSQTIPVGSTAPSITQTGLFHVYIPTLAELQNLGAWLWYQDWNVQSFSRLFSDPVSNILALARAPIDLGTLFSNDTATIHFANLSTGVSANYLSSSNARHDWGEVDIKQFWGGAMDFSPYTKMQLYLPWGTGFVDLKISDFMGGSIRIYTNFDAVSGDCLHILVDGHGRALYSYPGNIYQNIPFSGSKSLSSALSGIVGAGTSFAMGYVTGGAGGGLAAAALSSARSVANADFNAQRGGNSGAAGALMGVQYPYIIMDRPIQSIPASFGADRGYPSNVTAQLSSLKGYTEVREIHLDGIPATEVELSEIETLLKGGVFL